MNRFDPALSPAAARAFIWAEKYVVPIVYALLAAQRLAALLLLPRQYREMVASGQAPPHAAEIYFASLVKQGLLVALMVFAGAALLLNRPPRELPDRVGQVLVPLVASFYFVLYGALDFLPGWLGVNWIPARYQPLYALLGVLCSAAGWGICLWALFYLRRSFALWVSVREVVTGGPYRYVRHPIYLGYFLDQAGLCLAGGSPGFLLLSVGYVCFQVHRARLEEAKLSAASSEYRRYAQATGAFWPLKAR